MANVNARFYACVAAAVTGLAFIFGWNISSPNAASFDWNTYFNKSTYADYVATFFVGIMPIGAIIGALSSGVVQSKMGVKGSMIATSCLQLVGCLCIFMSYQMHPKPEFKQDENYEESLQIAFDARPESEKTAEQRKMGEGEYFSLKNWTDDGNTGYSHVGFEESFPFALYLLSAGRLLIGIFIGVASAVCPRYIMDICPKEIAGTIGVLNQLLITVGILAANLFGTEALFKNSSRLILCFPAFISIGFIVILALGILPESPKYLYANGEHDEAKESLRKVRGDDADLTPEMADMKKESETAGDATETSVAGLFKIAGIRWQLFTLIFMHIAQPMSGINAVFFYSNQIFEAIGIEKSKLATYSIYLSTLNVVMTIVSTYVMDKMGRKKLLLGGYAVAVLCLLGLVATVPSEAGAELSKAQGMLALASLLGFICGFAVGPGPIPWMYNNELFPTISRTASGTVGCLTNWVVNFIVSKVFPKLQQAMGVKVFLIFIIFSAVTCVYCWAVVPETKGQSAVQTYNKFAKRNGVPLEDEETVPLKDMPDV